MDLENVPPFTRDDKISEEDKKLISSLPSSVDFYGNKRGFQPQDTDIILASFPKCGTTWLKALTVALLERSKNHSSVDHQHPLLTNNPHAIVPFFELDIYFESSSPDLSKFSSHPRLFSTHMPLHAMQKTLEKSPCKIVYVCRNVKDTLISTWFFICSICKMEPNTSTLESVFELFCNGTIFYGPFWEHVLGYWRRSLEHPKQVLFMKYEEIKAEPRVQLKRLAEFLGCPFTKEEEEKESGDEILDLCSLRNLSGLEVNKTGKTKNIDYKILFRKGEVGDWKNYLTRDMENKIDMIIQEKLQGSGLEF